MNAAQSVFCKMRAALPFVAFGKSSFIEVVEVEIRLEWVRDK